MDNDNNAQGAILGAGCFTLIIAALMLLVALLTAIADMIGL